MQRKARKTGSAAKSERRPDLTVLSEFIYVGRPSDLKVPERVANELGTQLSSRSQSGDDVSSWSPCLGLRDLRPGGTYRSGQKGFGQLMLKYSFFGEPGGHYQHSGGYNCNMPYVRNLNDGEYVTDTLGEACGVLRVEIVGYGYVDYRVITAEYQDIGVSADYVLIGSTPRHPNNHFGTPSTNKLLRKIAAEYRQQTGSKLYFNDMSLPWGGLFDITGHWATPHAEHRSGNVIDIAATPATLTDEAAFFVILRKYTTNYIVEGAGNGRHYHIRF